MSTLIADFGLCWGKGGGWGVGGQLLRGPEKGCWEVEVVSCVVIHILQTHISVPGQKSDTFSHESWGGGLDLPDSLLSLPHCFCTLLPWSPAFPSWTSCFLWSTFYRLCSCLLWSTHLEGACIDISHKSNSYTWSTSASQGQKQAGETHDPGPLGTEPEWNPENLKHRNKLREWWMVTRKEPREYFCHFNLHKHLFITYPEINHVLGSEYYLLSIYKKDLCHLNSFWGF